MYSTLTVHCKQFILFQQQYQIKNKINVFDQLFLFVLLIKHVPFQETGEVNDEDLDNFDTHFGMNQEQVSISITVSA